MRFFALKLDKNILTNPKNIILCFSPKPHSQDSVNEEKVDVAGIQVEDVNVIFFLLWLDIILS